MRFFFTQLSFSLRASSAIFTVLSSYTVITTGDTKQSSSIVSSLSRCPDFVSQFFSHPSAGDMVSVWLSVEWGGNLVLFGSSLLRF